MYAFLGWVLFGVLAGGGIGMDGIMRFGVRGRYNTSSELNEWNQNRRK